MRREVFVSCAKGVTPEAYILQLRERPGVSEFLRRLRYLDLIVTYVDIDDKVISLTQDIGRYEINGCSFVHVPAHECSSSSRGIDDMYKVKRRLVHLDPELFVLIHITMKQDL